MIEDKLMQNAKELDTKREDDPVNIDKDKVDGMKIIQCLMDRVTHSQENRSEWNQSHDNWIDRWNDSPWI
jgi:hypothetical protein